MVIVGWLRIVFIFHILYSSSGQVNWNGQLSASSVLSHQVIVLSVSAGWCVPKFGTCQHFTLVLAVYRHLVFPPREAIISFLGT